MTTTAAPPRNLVRPLWLGAVLTLVIRPVVEVLSVFVIGPFLGYFDNVLLWQGLGREGEVVVAVHVVPAVAVMVALKTAQLIHQGSARAARIAPTLGAVFLADSLVYLASILALIPLLLAAAGFGEAMALALMGAAQVYPTLLAWRIARHGRFRTGRDAVNGVTGAR